MSAIKDIESLHIQEGKRPPLIFILLVAGLGLTAFLTGLSFVPGVDNNIGPFEVTALLLFGFSFVYFLKHRLRIQAHPLVILLYLLFVVAVMSLPNLSDRIDFGIIKLLLLVYSLLLVLIFFNIAYQFPVLLKYLLRFITVGASIAGAIILIEGVSTDYRISTGGTFRNRAHVGIYMLTAFWLVLLYFYWPDVSRRERVGTAVALLIILYAIAASGRRSVYLSLFIGIALLAASFIVLHGSGRFKISTSVVIVCGVLALMALVGRQYIPQLAFFNERIGLIDNQLAEAAGMGDEIEDADNFIVLQREGMIRAVSDHPFLGIGWGGFANSEYSPTGHEMHSTPQRFLAELGIIGFGIYMVFNGYLLFGSLWLFFQVRETKYQLPALLFAVGLWSLAISWVYNRSVTERTYWLLIVLFISFDALIRLELAKMKVRNSTEHKNIATLPQKYCHEPAIQPFTSSSRT